MHGCNRCGDLTLGIQGSTAACKPKRLAQGNLESTARCSSHGQDRQPALVEPLVEPLEEWLRCTLAERAVGLQAEPLAERQSWAWPLQQVEQTLTA